MTTERDPRTRIVLSWLREDEYENAERVLLRALDEVDTTPQRRSWWPAWRTNRMTTYAKLIAAAAVLVVVIVGYSMLPRIGIGTADPGATHAPIPSLIARGSFVEHDWGLVEFEASREGSSVTGRMTVAERDGWGPITVDLQCTRATEDGIVMIGGYITVGNQIWAAGTPALVAIKRGSPDRGIVGAGSLMDEPATQTTGCLAYLDAWLEHNRRTLGADWIPHHVLDGGVEFGP